MKIGSMMMCSAKTGNVEDTNTFIYTLDHPQTGEEFQKVLD